MSRSVYPPRSSWERPKQQIATPAPIKRNGLKLPRRGTAGLSSVNLLIAAAILVIVLVLYPQKKPLVHYKTSTPTVAHHATKKDLAVLPTSTTLPMLNNGTACANGSVLTTVAHEDDDILFMNPDISDDIAAGKCMRTIYITAGDDGHGADYWQAREQGPLAAYAAMYNLPDSWTAATATVNGQPVTSYSLASQPLVSLLFLRIPDGDLSGEGFPSTHNQSLGQLRTNKITSITTIDGSATYTKLQLVAAIGALIKHDKPQVVNTQAFSPTLANGDHSDHQAVGYFTALAQQLYSPSTPLVRYIGYQSGTMPVNLSQDQINSKIAIFSAYDQHDAFICDQSDGDCPGTETYQGYTMRQYKQTEPIGNIKADLTR